MRALICQTEAIVPVAAFGPALADAGIELVRWRTDAGAPPRLDEFGAVIALGGTANPDEDDRHPWLETERVLLRDALRRELPVVGLCLGAQLLAQVTGGVAQRLERPEIGWRAMPGAPGAADDPVYASLPRRPHVFEWHEYGFSLPPGAALLAGTPGAVRPAGWRRGRGRCSSTSRSTPRRSAAGSSTTATSCGATGSSPASSRTRPRGGSRTTSATPARSRRRSRRWRSLRPARTPAR